jgi:hypothetical protein
MPVAYATSHTHFEIAMPLAAPKGDLRVLISPTPPPLLGTLGGVLVAADFVADNRSGVLPTLLLVATDVVVADTHDAVTGPSRGSGILPTLLLAAPDIAMDVFAGVADNRDGRACGMLLILSLSIPALPEALTDVFVGVFVIAGSRVASGSLLGLGVPLAVPSCRVAAVVCF